MDRADEWNAGRVVRARVIELILLGERDDRLVHHRGLQLAGARIDGHLNLSYGAISAQLTMRYCAFTEPVSMGEASLRFLNLSGSRLPALHAPGIDVPGGVLLGYGFEANGEVCLHGAHIGGNLDCDHGRFNNPDGYALHPERIDVAGNAYLRKGFEATGEVRLYGARIGGNLDCSEGRFINPDGNALNAARIVVTGEATFRAAEFARGRSP